VVAKAELAHRPGSGENICWIAFDAVGTLIDAEPPVKTAYHRVALRHGSRLTEDEIAARFTAEFQRSEARETAGPESWQRSDRLSTSEAQERNRWKKIVANVIDDVADDEGCFEELFKHFARPASWRCYSDVTGTLTSLRDAGYQLAVASNFDQRLHAICDGLPELEPLQLRVISSQVGYRKPSRHFFESLIRAAGCDADEILLVGDDSVNDVQGGQAAGINALQLARHGQSDSAAISNLLQLTELLDA